MAMLAQQMQLANAMMPGTQLQPVVSSHSPDSSPDSLLGTPVQLPINKNV